MNAATPDGPTHRRARATLGRILRYSFPHWRTIVIVFALMGVYGAAQGLRFAMIGLVLDGVVLPGDPAAKKGKMLRFFEGRVLPHLPESVVIPRSYSSSESTTRLEVTSGDFEGAEVSKNEWRGEYTAGVANYTGSNNAVITGYAFDKLVVLLPTPPIDNEPPFVVTGATVRLSRSEGAGTIFPLLAAIACLGVILALVIAATNFGREYLAQKVRVRTIGAIRTDIFRHLSGLSLDFFAGRRSGDLISRLTNDVGTVQQSLRYIFGDLIQHPITIVTMLVVALTASVPLTLMVLPFFPILIIPILRSGRRVKRHGRGSLQKLGEVTETMGQLLSGIRVVKAFGMERAQWREFDERHEGFMRASLRMVRAKVTARSSLEGLYNLMAAAAILFGGWLITREVFTLSLGEFGMFIGAITALYQPLKSMTRIYNTVNESLAGAERVLDLLDETSTIEDRPDATPFAPLTDSIAFEGLCFRYGPQEPWVLREIDFTVRKGETIALVGPSGAGKSTLLDLLARFQDPTEGRILIDGRDLREGTHSSLLSQLAIVGQDAFLFHTTIAENIRHGRPDATEEEMWAAARAAAIADEIEAMPEGFETVIGERGLKVSGGQRQRITISRAILKNASILILDEATSALDTESERKVQRALDNLLEGRTTFVIAHRLSTIRNADRILVLEAGHIVESGSHESLVARGGAYARLLRMQELADEPPPPRPGEGDGGEPTERDDG